MKIIFLTIQDGGVSAVSSSKTVTAIIYLNDFNKFRKQLMHYTYNLVEIQFIILMIKAMFLKEWYTGQSGI